MAPDSGERHSLQEEGQQPMGGMVETPLGRAPGAREAVGPPSWVGADVDRRQKAAPYGARASRRPL